MQKLFVLSAILLLFAACSGPKTFISPAFKTKGPTHKTVAVLPFEVNNNGKPPTGMTEERKQKIAEEEAKAFQQSLYNNLMNNLGQFHLQIQPPNKTINLLRENGVEITKVAASNPDALAKMLGVDAVVFSTVTKHRYLDDKTSMGIDAGKQILGAVTKGQSNQYTWGISSKTNDILVTCSLIDAKDGEVLWKINDDKPADWSRLPNEIVDKINHRLAKRFPYKKLKKK